MLGLAVPLAIEVAALAGPRTSQFADGIPPDDFLVAVRAHNPTAAPRPDFSVNAVRWEHQHRFSVPGREATLLMAERAGRIAHRRYALSYTVLEDLGSSQLVEVRSRHLVQLAQTTVSRYTAYREHAVPVHYKGAAPRWVVPTLLSALGAAFIAVSASLASRMLRAQRAR